MKRGGEYTLLTTHRYYVITVSIKMREDRFDHMTSNANKFYVLAEVERDILYLVKCYTYFYHYIDKKNLCKVT